MIWLLSICAALFGAVALALVPDRFHWGRYALIASVPLMVVFVWFAVHSYLGWPLPASQPPTGAVFVAGLVDEPKEIDLWMIPKGSSQPRAYKLPYSESLYRQVLGAQKVTAAGGMVTAQPVAHSGHSMGRRIPKWALRRYKLPPQHLPPKQNGR